MYDCNMSLKIITPATWCNGCGNFGIERALIEAINELGLNDEKVLLCFDVGCNGDMSDKISGFRVHTLHGRVIPIAYGAKVSNPEMIVIALGGDGATYGEGINHFIHAIRRDYPITLLVHDNQNYGLTTGQCSPTTTTQLSMNSNPHGQEYKTVSGVGLANLMGCNFIAQGYSGDFQGLKEIIKAAITFQIKKKKFSLVNILQACPTYNKSHTSEWYFSNTTKLVNEYDQNKSRVLKNLENVSMNEVIKDPYKYVGILKKVE